MDYLGRGSICSDELETIVSFGRDENHMLSRFVERGNTGRKRGGYTLIPISAAFI